MNKPSVVVGFNADLQTLIWYDSQGNLQFKAEPSGSAATITRVLNLHGDTRVTTLITIGDDEEGQMLVSKLSSQNWVEPIVVRLKTSATVFEVSNKEGFPDMFTGRRGEYKAQALATADEILIPLLNDHDQSWRIAVGASPQDLHLSQLLLGRIPGKRIFLPGKTLVYSEDIRKFEGLADIFICNQDEYRAILQFRDRSQETDFEWMHAFFGARLVVVTCNSHGVEASFENQAIQLPAVKVVELCDIAAGDTFLGALAHEIIYSKNGSGSRVNTVSELTQSRVVDALGYATSYAAKKVALPTPIDFPLLGVAA
ncbi:MAG TPA: carbohydrate kinase family protein [Patescibacteria group bacterium]|nr:carbohydrate kinase family protein [Patescibacteria group bacterium]